LWLVHGDSLEVADARVSIVPDEQALSHDQPGSPFGLSPMSASECALTWE
jgi:hypothetical protein